MGFGHGAIRIIDHLLGDVTHIVRCVSNLITQIVGNIGQVVGSIISIGVFAFVRQGKGLQLAGGIVAETGGIAVDGFGGAPAIGRIRCILTGKQHNSA